MSTPEEAIVAISEKQVVKALNTVQRPDKVASIDAITQSAQMVAAEQQRKIVEEAYKEIIDLPKAAEPTEKIISKPVEVAEAQLETPEIVIKAPTKDVPLALEALEFMQTPEVPESIEPVVFETTELPVFMDEVHVPQVQLADLVPAPIAQEVMLIHEKMPLDIRANLELDEQTPQTLSSEVIKLVDEEPDYELLEVKLPFLMMAQETPQPTLSETDKAVEHPNIIGQITEHIRTLEPAQSEEAKAIFGVVMKKIEQLQEFTELENASINFELVEEELIVLCTRLLVCMNIEPEPKTIKHLILAIKMEHKAQIRSSELALDKGTHEHKLSINQLVHSLPDIIHPASSWLGKYALYLTAPLAA